MTDQNAAADTENDAQEELREAESRARQRVEEIKGFYHHLTIYLIVNAFLFLIDIFTGGGSWFFWPLFGWGVAIVIHAANTFDFLPWTTRDWEERKVRELMAKERGEHRH